MKKIIQYVMIASIFAACNSKSDLDTNKDVIVTDPGMYKSNIMTDTGSVIETSTLNSGNEQRAVANKQVSNSNRSTPRTTNRRNTNRSNRVNTSNTNSGQTTTTTTTAPRKKGWSHAAKDATIGGVGGAVTGAIISKDKVKGAVIGGIIGATGGYILGRKQDKKEGRIQ